MDLKGFPADPFYGRSRCSPVGLFKNVKDLMEPLESRSKRIQFYMKKGIGLKHSVRGVYYTNFSILPIKNMLCSKL